MSRVSIKSAPKTSKTVNKQTLNHEELDPNALSVVIDAGIDKRSLVGHHINSFNLFISQGLGQIVTQLFKVENTIQNERAKTPEDAEIESIHYLVKFTDIRVGRPIAKHYHSNQEKDLMPNQARRSKLNLSSPLFIDATIVATAYPKDNGEPRIRTEKVSNLQIANFPTMVRSSACHTYEMTPAILKQIEEDPQDPGGYFPIKGGEWCISCIETRLFNSPHIFRNVGHEKEIARLEFISKPGDAFENSSSLTMKYVQNGNIYILLDSIDYFKMDIPFYIIFRLMGMVTDQEICDNIIFGYSSATEKDIVSDHMFQILERALTINDPVFGKAHTITDQGKLLEFFAQQTSIFHQAKNGSRSSGRGAGSQGTGSANSGIDLATEIDDKVMKYLITNIVQLLDKWLLPHIGVGPETRHTKLRYLGYLIHKMLLVEMQIMESTDRDSLKNKRINAAGMSYAKAFKRDFNLTVIQPVKKKLRKDFMAMSFSQVPLAQSFASAIDAPALEKALIQAIVTGDKELTIKNRQVANRMASEMLHRKNQLNFLNTLRVIRTPSTSSSKQDQRADEMRRVHPSYTGFICPIQSADTGEQVGMVKQMSLGMFISNASSSELLKRKILDDPDIISLNKVFPEQIHRERLTFISVNGDWIGFAHDPVLIWHRYREAKRSFLLNHFGNGSKTTAKASTHMQLQSPLIDPHTTIYWNTDANEISFWVDVGRPLRTVLVVRNNSELDPIGREHFKSKGFANHDPKKYPGGFVQDIMLTQYHINKLMRKEMTIDDLLEQGIIDYISPEEMENAYIAQDLDTLKKKSRDPLNQYTHCEIPQSLVGLPALTSPYTQNNQPPRITFQTNQVKQTNGLYALNWPYRTDKHAFLQYNIEIPIIKTLANKYVYPNGVNAVIAILSYGGYNQEDSLIYNKGASQRGFVKGVHFGYVQAELEKDEQFGNPDIVHTSDIKMHANYSKLANGFPRRGMNLTNKDVAIGKFMAIPKPTDKRLYKDTSVMYPHRETATVEAVTRARDQESVEFARVKYSSVRQLGIGDKFCLLPTAEVLTNTGWKKIIDVNTADLVATLNPETHALEYHNPTNTVQFDHSGPLYHLKYQQVEIVCTLNHKLYIKKRGRTEFELETAENVNGKRVKFKKNCMNMLPDIEFKSIKRSAEMDATLINMDDWLELLGIFIADGNLDNQSYGRIKLSGKKQCKRDKIRNLANRLGVVYKYYGEEQNYIYSKDLYSSMFLLNVGAGNKFLPEIVWQLSQRQARLLLETLIACDGSYNNNGSAGYYTSSKQLADDVSRLALHAGWSGTVKLESPKGTVWNIEGRTGTTNYDSLYVRIVKTKNEPQINHGHVRDQNIQEENLIEYTGTVHCIEITNHIFYMRNSKYSPPFWTGNSSRAGQKGVTGLGYIHSDMPYTKHGVVPDLILNPHALPSRMTIGQLVESQTGRLAAVKACLGDATIFKQSDSESVGDELQSLGFDRYSNERMFDGRTGEWIDTEIFIAPTYYQRLQKFVVEEVYSISTGPTCVITRQPLEGKANRGGLRIGEMEKDVIISHGASHFLMEKFRDDSDGIDIYVCRNCGTRPVVNEKRGIIICNTCNAMGLDPQPVKVRSTWASKLFFQELESINVGVRLGLNPYEYESKS